MKKELQIRNSTVEFLTFVLDGKEDGVQVLYKDETMLCPLTTDDVLPDYPLQHVRYFNMDE